MIGPSLLDLQELVKASEKASFFIFLACSIGYLSGNFIRKFFKYSFLIVKNNFICFANIIIIIKIIIL